MTEYEAYTRMQIDTGVHPSQVVTMGYWNMLSPAASRDLVVALQARIEELHRSADTRYAHYERVTELAMQQGSRIAMMSKQEWEEQALIWKVGVIVNRQERAGLPGSRWTPDTPAGDVVAW
jgi:hypothetical protein